MSSAQINQIAMTLPEEKRQKFYAYAGTLELKDTTTAILITLFLGGFGGHHFYMGRTGLGVLYLLTFWTLIPSFAAFIELFLMSGRVKEYNARLLQQAQAMAG